MDKLMAINDKPYILLAEALGWSWLEGRVSVGEQREFIAAAEAEIARRGLLVAYGKTLLQEIDPDAQVFITAIYPDTPGDSYEWIAAIATAPPEARVRAMLAVLEGAHQ